MRRTEPKFSPDRTSEQEAAHLRTMRKNELTMRKLCNVLEFWRMCIQPRCRRNQACGGDGRQCFPRHWDPLPEGVKDEIRNDIRTVARESREREQRHGAS